MIQIGNRREFVWDDFLIDETQTTAERRLHEPVLREKVFEFDAPWEGNATIYFSSLFVPEKNVWRMYYRGAHMKTKMSDTQSVTPHICCIESPDGIHWARPDTGRQNIVFALEDMPEIGEIDNFYVMYDQKPSKEVPQRFKATMSYRPYNNGQNTPERKLLSLVSDDGYSFKPFGFIHSGAAYDSLNTVINFEGGYVCFFRSMHDPITNADFDRYADWNSQVRDIRVCYSQDFISWTEPERLTYSDGQENLPMYTNGISSYPGAPHMLIGIPTRYVEREEWTSNFDRLCGSKERKERMEMHPRFGLTTTDCAFMCSRDGKHFYRYEEAFLKPGPESPENWVYGRCYPCIGMIPTPDVVPGSDPVLSIYDKFGHWHDCNASLYRYTLRMDGFVSMRAGGEEKVIVTKPFQFTGKQLSINFSTSARGYARIQLIGQNQTIESEELFGDSINRIVDFNQDLSVLSGQEVVMKVFLNDADFYAWQFQ